MTTAPIPRGRSIMLSAAAAPLFALGYLVLTVALAARWCRAAVLTGADAARERWRRAG